MNIGILISGRGSNMVALVDAVHSGEIRDSRVVVVISDKADAAGLEKARERGVETVVVERNGRKREEHDAEIIAELKARGAELVCLAGYMRLLSPGFVQAFPDRIVNIHPSLLPAFPGLDAQKQAFDAGVKVTGCTVHYVDELLDHGSVILQRKVERLQDDTIETLSARILEMEHKLYTAAIRRLVVSNLLISQNDADRALIEVLDIGLDTSMRGEGVSLRTALDRVNYSDLRNKFDAAIFRRIIKERPYYVEEWLMYSEDKRTDGGWWLEDKIPSIGNLETGEERIFGTVEEATAEYIIRELDFWSNL